MKLSGNYTFEASLTVVWDALFDASVLARTLPGCDKLDKEGNQFSGVIRVKIGPVQGEFQGKVAVSDIDEYQSYRMTIDGRGPAGFAEAKVLISLKSEGEATCMTYNGDIHVGGRVASVEQRSLEASIKAITKQGLENLHTQIKSLNLEATGVAQQDNSVTAKTSQPDEASVTSEESNGSSAEDSLTNVDDNDPSSGDKSVLKKPEIIAAEAPRQAAFAMGIAREVTKELFPINRVVLVAAVLILGWAVFQVLN